MNKLKTFYYSFKRSITSPSYYQDIVNTSISFSFKYILLLSYFVVLFYTTFIVANLAFALPQLPDFIETTKTRLSSFYPEDLVITINDGRLSTNKKEPIYFDVPELQEEDFDHVITIDTNAQAEDYFDYDTYILVTDDVVMYPENDLKNYTEIPIESEENMTINRSDYDALINRAMPMLDALPSTAPFILIGMLLFFPLIGAVFEFSRHIITVTVLSVITLLISFALQNKLSYTKLFQMGLHAATIPIILMTVAFVLGLTIPLLYISSFLLWMVIILTQYHEVKG